LLSILAIEIQSLMLIGQCQTERVNRVNAVFGFSTIVLDSSIPAKVFRKERDTAATAEVPGDMAKRKTWLWQLNSCVGGA
jgi:hypothetical protein